jgi:membrane associated rhomboid family serine protease
VRIIVVPAFFFLGFWILLQILYGMFLSYGSNIAFFAHIGGFFAGIFSIRWMKRRKLLGWRI